MRLTEKIVFASLNRKKWEELRDLLAPHGIELLEAEGFIRNAEKLPLVETFQTYSENAAAKARLANQAAHYPCLADDSGLEVQALEGRPGARSARFAIPRAGETQDQANVKKLMEDLSGVTGEKRAARFRTVLALVMEGLLVLGEGTLEGVISDAPRGKNGFGYDPVFIPKGEKRTLAEMTFNEKNAFSHRADAVRDLIAKIESHGLSLARP